MKLIKLFPVFVLSLALLACTISVNVPKVRTGVTQTLEIRESALTETGINKINIEMGAGSLTIDQGTDQLIEGTVKYNVTSWKPSITRTSDEISFSQKNTDDVGVPDGDIKNNWDLQLGEYPIDLRVTTGASNSEIDLSGLSITNLSIADGASKSRVVFDSPNPVEMNQLSYKTGASDVDLLGLGYANVEDVSFESGVGSYTLDFAGELQRDMDVRIRSGMSDMTIIIPESTHAYVTMGDGVSNINTSGTWTVSGTTYECGSTGPTININIEMAVGNLTLKQE